MLPDKIMQSTLLDILFENKNKLYGAYALRTSYNKTMRLALGVTIILSASFCLLLNHDSKERSFVTTVIIPPDIIFSGVKPNIPKPPAVVQRHQQNNFRKINNSIPVIANNDVKTTQPTIDAIEKSLISNITTDGDAANGNEVAPSTNNIGSGLVTTTETPVLENNAPLLSADIMPEFPGGTDALIKFMLRNIHQPDDIEAGEKIKVIASFVVSKTGSIENIKIINSGRADLDKEVMRVINKMPLWKPGFQHGNAVAVYFNLPVTFQSSGD